MSMYSNFAEIANVGDRLEMSNEKMSELTGLHCGDVSMTKQEFRDECDINVILKGYQKGRAITHLNKYEGRFEDVADAPLFHEAQNIILKAQAMFDDLPSAVRDRFGNDPAQFLEFVHDAKNEQELVDMGLAKARPVEAPAAPPVASVVPEAPKTSG